MVIKKKLSFLIISVVLFVLASSAFAVTIPNPLGPNVNDFGALLTKIAGWVGGFVASISVIMIIVAGIMFLLSAGSPEKINTAKKALAYAIIGMVIGISATAISQMILSILT